MRAAIISVVSLDESSCAIFNLYNELACLDYTCPASFEDRDGKGV